ncbi:MAG: PEGA domain-containing protein [Candidatus Omnitrophica bacterium]|nr:PEGA domain-containing protein [Candidatus Omnitrophota bacterium]
MKLSQGVIFILLLFLISGCATFSRYEYQNVTGPVTVKITSEPMGAKIIINGEYVGRTPLQITLERGGYYNSRLKAFIADKPIFIEALPFKDAGYPQYKAISVFETIPSHIHFKMLQPPQGSVKISF